MDNNLYVIAPVFNPFGFKSRSRLYRNFAKHMEASGAKLLTVEAAFADHDWEVTSTDNPWNVRLRTDQIIWQKEALVNVGLRQLAHIAPNSRFIGWFDTDITFANPNWVEDTIRKLMIYKVIQPFGTAINLDANDEPMWNCPSSFRSFIEERGFHQDPPMPLRYIFKGHPGLAWAATREALDNLGGLYDACAAGSGDTVMSNALKGGWDQFLPCSPSPGMITSMKKWADKCDKYVKGKIGYSHGTLLHHWHGKSEKRGYEKRWSILAFHKFDPLEDLVRDTHGLWRWAGNKPRLEDDLRLSLGSRNEDEV